MDMGGHDHSGMGDSSSCKISMLWNWYTVDACFLSSSWHVKNGGMMAASCIGVAALTVTLEFLRRLSKEYDERVHRQFQQHLAARAAIASSVTDDAAQLPQFATFRYSPLQQLIRSVLHMATFGVAYIIMLLAMYFNGFIIISIFLGAGIGKFFCDWTTRTVPLNTAASCAPGNSNNNNNKSGIDEPTVCCG